MPIPTRRQLFDRCTAICLVAIIVLGLVMLARSSQDQILGWTTHFLATSAAHGWYCAMWLVFLLVGAYLGRPWRRIGEDHTMLGLAGHDSWTGRLGYSLLFKWPALAWTFLAALVLTAAIITLADQALDEQIRSDAKKSADMFETNMKQRVLHRAKNLVKHMQLKKGEPSQDDLITGIDDNKSNVFKLVRHLVKQSDSGLSALEKLSIWLSVTEKKDGEKEKKQQEQGGKESEELKKLANQVFGKGAETSRSAIKKDTEHFFSGPNGDPAKISRGDIMDFAALFEHLENRFVLKGDAKNLVEGNHVITKHVRNTLVERYSPSSIACKKLETKGGHATFESVGHHRLETGDIVIITGGSKLNRHERMQIVKDSDTKFGFKVGKDIPDESISSSQVVCQQVSMKKSIELLGTSYSEPSPRAFVRSLVAALESDTEIPKAGDRKRRLFMLALAAGFSSKDKLSTSNENKDALPSDIYDQPNMELKEFLAKHLLSDIQRTVSQMIESGAEGDGNGEEPAKLPFTVGITPLRLRTVIRGEIQFLTFVFFAWGLIAMLMQGIVRHVIFQASYLLVARKAEEGVNYVLDGEKAKNGEAPVRWVDVFCYLAIPGVASISEKCAGYVEDLFPRLIRAVMRIVEGGGTLADAEAEAERAAKEWQADFAHESYLLDFVAWVLPALGFIGTVVGIGQGMATANRVITNDIEQQARTISEMTEYLGTAFFTTLVALACVIPYTFFGFLLTRLRDLVVIRCKSLALDCAKAYRDANAKSSRHQGEQREPGHLTSGTKSPTDSQTLPLDAEPSRNGQATSSEAEKDIGQRASVEGVATDSPPTAVLDRDPSCNGQETPREAELGAAELKTSASISQDPSEAPATPPTYQDLIKDHFDE